MSFKNFHKLMSVPCKNKNLVQSHTPYQRITSFFKKGDSKTKQPRAHVNSNHHTPNHRVDRFFETIAIKTHLALESILDHRLGQAALIAAFGYLLMDPVCAAVDETLQEAVVNLQKEIFGSGWITVGKIAAAAVGAVMAIARSSAVPFAMGAGVAGGLHFFQIHTKAAATCVF